MKKTIHYLTFIALITSTVFTSCVSSKKFTASETKLEKLQKENAITIDQLNECNTLLMNTKDEKASVEQENELMQKEYATIQEIMALRSSESKMTIGEQARRLNNLQNTIDAQAEKSNQLKNSIANALINYKADELTVYLKDGNVHVSLAEKLLFKSASDFVDAKGKKALKSLADVLKTSSDFTVAIEGHTDNIPIKTLAFQDNWDLSTARATAIVRILTNEYGFDSKRITASGKSHFHPVTTNETPKGRADNRRTEIILSPDLQQIYKLLYE
ncbi:MAG: OmpA family protein [Tenuifilaceae bacterium]|nr:OmpA family protein [Tenuifilaceae bacterium]